MQDEHETGKNGVGVARMGASAHVECREPEPTYRFTPVDTARLRVVLTQPRNLDPGHRCYAVREIRSAPSTAGSVAAGFRVLGALATMPVWLEPGANLAVPEAGVQIALGKLAEVRWPRRLLVNCIRVEPAISSPAIEWWDGTKWRAVEPLPAPKPGESRFLPVSTDRLRITSAEPPQRLEARLDSDAERYFGEVERSRVDLLGARFRETRLPDLAAAQSLILPLDFAKAAIGRPADKQETMVLWNGTWMRNNPDFGLPSLLLTEPAYQPPRLRKCSLKPVGY